MAAGGKKLNEDLGEKGGKKNRGKLHKNREKGLKMNLFGL